MDSSIEDADNSSSANSISDSPGQPNQRNSSEASSYSLSNTENSIYAKIKLYDMHTDNVNAFGEKSKHDDTIKLKLLLLFELQNLIVNQLPKMGFKYINDLIINENSRSILLLKHHRVLGGFTFRIFEKQNFAEVLFCVIQTKQQGKGYGVLMMNLIKEYCIRFGISRVLTYADKYALKYFEKQGFSKKITLPKGLYNGRIVECEDADLMECRIDSNYKCPNYSPLFLNGWLGHAPNPSLDNEHSNSMINGASDVHLPEDVTDLDPKTLKKRGRKRVRKSPNEYKQMDAFLNELAKQTGLFRVKKVTSSMKSRFKYLPSFKEINLLHSSKKHYRTPKMLYYDLILMLRSFKYFSKSSTAVGKVVTRLESFIKRNMSNLFQVKEIL